jgi:hypothetical protein
MCLATSAADSLDERVLDGDEDVAQLHDEKLWVTR